MDNFITETQRESLIELYVGYFDRAPEEAGLNYWSQEFLSGLQSGKEEAVVLKEIADQFYSAGVQFGVYSSAMTIEEFIKTGYKNALGRDLNAESAVDRDIAVNYWSEQLNSGAVSRGQFIMQLVSDAKAFEGDATWGWVADYMANRVAVSKWFAENSDYLSDNDAIVQGTQALTVVTEATVKAGQTVADAVSAAEAAAATSDLFTLTHGTDSIPGTSGNDTFVAKVGQNVNGEQTNTLGTGDYIDGGAGTDTLNAKVITASALNAPPSMAITPETVSVENVNISAQTNNWAVNNVEVNAKDMLGLESIGSTQSDASLIISNLTR